MKRIFLAILVITSLFLFVGCNFNFNFSGAGVLRVNNNSSYTIKAFVMYTDDGELNEAYRNDGVYEGSEVPNIKSNSYKDYEVDCGDYDIWFYMVADGYWYYTEIEDVYVYYNNTTEVSVEDGNWILLVPSKASSMYNKLPEDVKNQIFTTIN
jgi:hypothetical protein